MSYLVTTSFIDAVEWLENAPASWKERAYQGLYDQLARKPWGEPNPDIARGMKFESTVYETLEKRADEQPTFNCSEEFRFFLNECKGGIFQKKLKRIEVIDGREYCLYGKADVYFNDVIKDIKACAEYGGQSKYLGKCQHLLYAYITQVKKFKYLVAEFGPVPNMKIRRKFEIEWDAPEDGELQDAVHKRVRKAVGFVEQDKELWKLYTTTFSRY